MTKKLNTNDITDAIGISEGNGNEVGGREARQQLAALLDRIAELEEALQTIKRVYDTATYTHGGDLRGLDDAAIDRALATVLA